MSNRRIVVEAAIGARPLDVIIEGTDSSLSLDGIGATTASTPDHSSLDLTGDLDIRVEANLDWTASGTLVSKWGDSSNQRSYWFRLVGDLLTFNYSTNGTNSTSIQSAVSLPFVTGQHAVRVTFDADNGATQNVVTFYTADSITGSWTQLDQQTNSGTVTIHSGSAILRVGGIESGGSSLSGNVFAAEVRSSIGGTVVADPDFAAEPPRTTSFTDSTGKTWTLNGGAVIVPPWTELVDTDGRPRAMEASWSIGRDDELEHFPAGQATVRLRNRDRALDPDNPDSPHAGLLLPYTPVRLRSLDVDGGTFDDEFYGFVHGGWEQDLAPKQSDVCVLELVDLLGVISGRKLPDVFDHMVLSKGPVAYWVLDNPTDAEQVPDLSGSGHDGTVIGNVSFGETPIRDGHSPSAFFPGDLDADDETEHGAHVFVSRSPIVAPGDLANASVMATFAIGTVPSVSTEYRRLFVHGNGEPPSATGTRRALVLQVDSNRHLDFAVVSAGTATARSWQANIADDRGHIVIASALGIAVDNATFPFSSGVTQVPTVNGVGIGGMTRMIASRSWRGRIGHVALWDRQLGSTDRSDIMGIFGWRKLDGRLSGEHIEWALDRVGVPTALRNIADGTVPMGPAMTGDRDVVEWMRDVTATEGGSLYVDHRNGGKIKFTDRYHRFLTTRSTTAQATFADAPAAGEIGYAADNLDVAPNGVDGIVNQVTVTWRGGEITVDDTESIEAFGPRTRQLDTQATAATQARSAGEWLLARYNQPRSRIRGALASRRVTYDRDDNLQGLLIDDLVNFRIHPLEVDDPSTVQLFVDGMQHTARGVEWHTVVRFAQAELFTPWIWGTSTWGETTAWG